MCILFFSLLFLCFCFTINEEVVFQRVMGSSSRLQVDRRSTMHALFSQKHLVALSCLYIFSCRTLKLERKPSDTSPRFPEMTVCVFQEFLCRRTCLTSKSCWIWTSWAAWGQNPVSSLSFEPIMNITSRLRCDGCCAPRNSQLQLPSAFWVVLFSK